MIPEYASNKAAAKTTDTSILSAGAFSRILWFCSATATSSQEPQQVPTTTTITTMVVVLKADDDAMMRKDLELCGRNGRHQNKACRALNLSASKVIIRATIVAFFVLALFLNVGRGGGVLHSVQNDKLGDLLSVLDEKLDLPKFGTKPTILIKYMSLPYSEKPAINGHYITLHYIAFQTFPTTYVQRFHYLMMRYDSFLKLNISKNHMCTQSIRKGMP
jgi:hypothetical protein